MKTELDLNCMRRFRFFCVGRGSMDKLKPPDLIWQGTDYVKLEEKHTVFSFFNIDIFRFKIQSMKIIYMLKKSFKG